MTTETVEEPIAEEAEVEQESSEVSPLEMSDEAFDALSRHVTSVAEKCIYYSKRSITCI